MAVARALVTRPALLFADEPTGNLDYTSGTEILDALWRSCVERRQTIVLVTHDSKAAAYADRVLVIGDGRIEDTIQLGRRDSHDAAPLIAGSPSSACRAAGRGVGLTGLAVAQPPRPAACGRPSAIARGRARRGGPVRRSRDERGHRAVDRADGDGDCSAARTCASRRSARRGCRGETLAAIAGTPGVAVAAPALERRTYLGAATPSGSAAAPGHRPGHRPGASMPGLHDLTLVAGSPLRVADEPSALITERLAAQDGSRASARR